MLLPELIAEPSVRQFDTVWKPVAGRASLIQRVITEPVDPDVQEGPQRWLNVIAVIIVLVAWAGVAITHYVTASVLLLAALALALLGSQLRRRGWLP